MNRTIQISAMAAVLFLVSTSTFSNDSLCTTSEQVVFSCSVKSGKTASICALPDNQGSAKISYRFGSAQKIEKEVVADTSQKSPPIEYDSNSGRAYTHLVRFKSGQYLYEAKTEWDGCPMPGATKCGKYSDFTGVVVYKSGKPLAHLACTSDKTFGPDTDLLSQLKVPLSK